MKFKCKIGCHDWIVTRSTLTSWGIYVADRVCNDCGKIELKATKHYAYHSKKQNIKDARYDKAMKIIKDAKNETINRSWSS